MVNKKHIFWQALVFTVIIFGIGFLIGYFIEMFRVDSSQLILMDSEVNVLDEQLRSSIISNSNVSCDLATKSTIAFADRIYGEALKLEQYDVASKFSGNTLLTLHRKYDILRVMLWFESKKIKEKCFNFHTVVYFFDYESQSIPVKAKQEFFSRLLLDVKNKYPNEILLIPIASNLNLSSVNLIKTNYNIPEGPAILIDEKKVISEVTTEQDLEEIIFTSYR